MRPSGWWGAGQAPGPVDDGHYLHVFASNAVDHAVILQESLAEILLLVFRHDASKVGLLRDCFPKGQYLSGKNTGVLGG